MNSYPLKTLLCLFAAILSFACIANTAQAQKIACPVLDDALITPYVGIWKGQLGTSDIEIHLEPHERDAQRLQGYYIHVSNPSHQILIVGEPLKGALEMEESSNGSDISGVWDLTLPEQASSYNNCLGTLQGEWLDGNFSNPQPVTLHREISW